VRPIHTLDDADVAGSDLHNYRGTDPDVGFVLGHEIAGEIIQVGSAVTKFKVGDVVVAPFASSCGE
jgi:threonine dehydrogenase-like Zn-dependent dehydrogenase